MSGKVILHLLLLLFLLVLFCKIGVLTMGSWHFPADPSWMFACF
jgi:hypothetical protein